MTTIIEQIARSKEIISEELNLHPPSRGKQILAKLGLRDIVAPDITDHPEELRQRYRFIAGDPDFGPGNDGHCQSRRFDPDWWKDIV
jgi:hypothetical protein